jgi:hypothetical protein
MSSELVWCGIWLVGLVMGRWRVRQTTLGPAWWWELGAVGLLMTFAILAGRGELSTSAASRWQYAAGVATLAPLMATLGAKRPQDRAWQFVVLAMLSVLILPALEAAIYHPRRSLQLSGVWQAFVTVLVVMGVLNWAGTRLWLAGALMTAAQICLLERHLPLWLPALERGDALVCGLALGALGALLRGLDWPGRGETSAGWSRVWVDFRDLFGTVWGLRIMERFNTSAKVCGWNLRLHWGGVTTDSEGSSTSAAEQGLQTLLRRFVSADWVEQRLKGP